MVKREAGRAGGGGGDGDGCGLCGGDGGDGMGGGDGRGDRRGARRDWRWQQVISRQSDVSERTNEHVQRESEPLPESWRCHFSDNTQPTNQRDTTDKQH